MVATPLVETLGVFGGSWWDLTYNFNLEWIDDSGLYTWDIEGMSTAAQLTTWKPRESSWRALCELVLVEINSTDHKRNSKWFARGGAGWIDFIGEPLSIERRENDLITIYNNWKWEKKGLTCRETREWLVLSSALDRRGRKRHLVVKIYNLNSYYSKCAGRRVRRPLRVYPSSDILPRWRFQRTVKFIFFFGGTWSCFFL